MLDFLFGEKVVKTTTTKETVKQKTVTTYTEQEVFKLLNKLNNTLNLGVDTDLTLEEWFKINKKK
jgi:hypothetical protein